MPDDFLTNFEIYRLELDNYCSITNMNYDKENLVMAFFLITKVLVARVLLQPNNYAGVKSKSENLHKNLKFVASGVQGFLRMYFEEILPIAGNSKKLQ